MKETKKKQARIETAPEGMDKPYWVTVGASAGGLEALKDLLSGLGDSLDAIVIIAQHLDPKHPTVLQDLLSRSSELPVTLVEESLTPKAGHIYIISPGHNALIQGDKIVLKPAAAIGPKPSVDLLFSSLAEAQSQHAIAVILSGTGSDGAQGAMAVKSAGGIVIVQDAKTAKYTGMPQSAIDTGFVDLVLPTADIALKVQAIVQDKGHEIELSTPKIKTHLEKIFQRLFDETGYDFSGYKLKTIQRRIARRMAVHRLVTLEDYVTLLHGSSTEVKSLFKDLLISVTSFFRDSEAFEDLEKVVEELVRSTEESQSIRIWVPGCANGEEAYSIAMLLRQAMQKLNREINFQIFGTDLDDFALSQARKGVYSQVQVKEIPDTLLSRFFYKKEDEYYISKSIRDHVVFARQNLIMDPPFSQLDLISCRNLLIYFAVDLQKKVMQTFHFALKPKGYLFLGKSESVTNVAPELFEPLYKRSQIFLRKQTHLSSRLDHVGSAVTMSANSRTPVNTKVQQDKKSILQELDKVLLTELLPAAIVIDNSGEVIHIRGEVNQYLSFPQGKIDTNILTLLKEDLRIDVRALLQKAKREGKAISQSLFFDNQQPKSALFLSVKTLNLPEQPQELFLLSFTQVDLGEAFVSSALLSEGEQVTKQNLQNEITLFKERLQTTIEELETTNEELQSTNEELQSANEELQSTNEELQTSNEELQSTNEELSTVNEELEIKGYELEQVNSDLENMLAYMNEKIILVDDRLRILRFTARASEAFELDESDKGHTITTVGMTVDIPNLRQELLGVMGAEQEKTMRVRKGKDVFQLRMVPYNSKVRNAHGVILFFEAAGHEAKQEHSNSGQLLESMAELLSCAMVVTDELGDMVYVNDHFCELSGYSKEDVLYQNVTMLMPTPYKAYHHEYMENYLEGRAFGNIGRWRDVTFLTKTGERLLLKLKLEENLFQNSRQFIALLMPQEVFYDYTKNE